ncbi:MAG: RHS repeat domain-containing protein, partial [Pirellulales bacterium]
MVRTVNGAEYHYLWDGENVFWQTNDVVAAVWRYTLEPAGYGNLLSEILGGFNAERFYHFDGLGSTARLSLPNDTVAGSNMTYQAFGQPQQSGDQFTPYRWLGQLGYDFQIIPLGGYALSYYDYANWYVRQRYLDRWTVRWSSRDPLWDDPRGNLYSYVANVPTVFSDPSGQFAWVPICCLACASVLTLEIGVPAATCFTMGLRFRNDPLCIAQGFWESWCERLSRVKMDRPGRERCAGGGSQPEEPTRWGN